MNTDDKAMTYAESAEMLGITVATLYSMVSRRQIPHVRLGKRLVRFSRARLLEWMASREVLPAEMGPGAARKETAR